MIGTEALLLTGLGSLGGTVLALLVGHGVEDLVKRLVPLAPTEALLWPSAAIILQTAGLGILIGIMGSLYPAWRASRLQPAEALKTE